MKKRKTSFPQLRSNFSVLADIVTKLYREGKAAEILSLLVNNLGNHLCGTATELSVEAVKDVFQRAMKDTFSLPKKSIDIAYNAPTFDLDEIEPELECA